MKPNDTAMASGRALPLCSRDMGVFHLLWSSSAVGLQQVLQQQQNPDKAIVSAPSVVPRRRFCRRYIQRVVDSGLAMRAGVKAGVIDYQ